MQTIIPLHNLRPHHSALGQLLLADLPVPAGFVITAKTFTDFLAKHVATPTPDAIIRAAVPRALAAEIMDAFHDLAAPYVAVRSSATAEDGDAHSWAGQLESFVPTSKNNLLQHIKRCWASLYSPRALLYGQQAGLTNQSMAVIVQRLVDSQLSGIAFSAHPVTGSTNHIVIESVQGLGEAAVGGHVTPHLYVLHKHNGQLHEHIPATQTTQLVRASDGTATWQSVARQMALTPEQLTELAAHVRHIENHFGFACDIEWTLEGNEFYIVQSRPITTLHKG